MADQKLVDGKDEEKIALTANDKESEVDTARINDVDTSNSKSKFINGGAEPEATVTIEDPVAKVVSGDDFVGLTKEELLKYSQDPYWVKLRWILFIGFWVVWIGMLAAAIIIIVVAPKCPPIPDQEWHEKAVVYKILPATFQDSDDDGIGDIKGVGQHLDYMGKFLNVSALLFAPLFDSNLKNLGYDVTNFKAINPKLGTKTDLENLRISLHKRSMKIILDIAPYQTSVDHDWYKKSVKKEGDFADYYMWSATDDGSTDMLGEKAYVKNNERNEFVKHYYSGQEPLLNLKNTKVEEEMTSVLKYWLDWGVDGFHIHGVENMFGGITADTVKLLDKWRTMMDTYTEDKGYKALMGSVLTATDSSKMLINTNGTKALDLVVTPSLTEMKKGCNGSCVRDAVDGWLQISDGKRTGWTIGSQDAKRVASVMGTDYVNAMNMLLLTLKGTPITYYGEEIGMTNTAVKFAQGIDGPTMKDEVTYNANNRDGQRTPMQWKPLPQAGFTKSNKPILPVNTEYITRNVKTQQAHGIGVSELEIFADVSLVQQEPSFMWGAYKPLKVSSNVMAFIRQAEGFPGFLVCINFGLEPTTVDFRHSYKDDVAEKGTLVANTANFRDVGHARDFAKGRVMTLDNIHIQAGEGLIFKWPAPKK